MNETDSNVPRVRSLSGCSFLLSCALSLGIICWLVRASRPDLRKPLSFGKIVPSPHLLAPNELFFVNPTPPPPKCDVWVTVPKKLRIHSEFGMELVMLPPHAYYLYQRCYHISVETFSDMEPFYYFADVIRTTNAGRQERGLKEDFSCCPFTTVHTPELPSEWLPPPYKTLFANTYYRYDKPLFIISNKYNSEWGHSPVNFLSVEVLLQLVDILRQNYTIVYNRPERKHIVYDTGALVGKFNQQFREKEILKERGVVLMDDLWKEAQEKWGKKMPYLTYNLLQCWVYANADRFVSVQGGNSVLTSYFAGPRGRVDILIKSGRELSVNSIHLWYSRFSGSSVHAHTTEQSLLNHISSS